MCGVRLMYPLHALLRITALSEPGYAPALGVVTSITACTPPNTKWLTPYTQCSGTVVCTLVSGSHFGVSTTAAFPFVLHERVSPALELKRGALQFVLQ